MAIAGQQPGVDAVRVRGSRSRRTSDTAPAIERSMPPCMTTRVWPSATIASTAANGSIPSSAPLLRLDDANSGSLTNSPAAATSTVVRPRKSRRLDPRGIAFLRPL